MTEVDIQFVCVGFALHLIISWTACVAFSFYRVFCN